MKLTAFRIKNFRSIVDSKWCTLSVDNITTLIGQNESGKTSILEALYCFSANKINDDYLRADQSLPEISVSFQIEPNDLDDLFPDRKLSKGLKQHLKQKDWRINLTRRWSNKDTSRLDLEESELHDLFVSNIEGPNHTEKIVDSNKNQSESQVPSETEEKSENSENDHEEVNQYVTEKQFLDAIWNQLPHFTYFHDEASLLPNRIDIDDLQSKKTDVEGYQGALNFLKIAELDLSRFSGDTRMVENTISAVNKKITKDFQKFWQQRIGKSSRIGIECDIKHHDVSVPETAGKPYLVFWIVDGEQKLYPKQRSQGVRWFLSFYLQIKASSLNAGGTGEIYLVDEPGARLHAKAQEDILSLLEDIKSGIQILYTTHSPYLVGDSKLYRILAVQRDDEEDDKSPTRILSYHLLASASEETLSPLYTAMGIDFSNQDVISKKNNVLLEEMSAYYYLSAFWKLTKSSKVPHFIAATGATNIPNIAYMFIGWGLDFIIVVDDDSRGRGVFNDLKRTLFQDNEEISNKKMFKIKQSDNTGCEGIEDLFSVNDFKKYIIENDGASIKDKDSKSKYMKDNKISKILTAVSFMLKIDDKKIALSDMTDKTQKNIKRIVESIEERLS